MYKKQQRQPYLFIAIAYILLISACRQQENTDKNEQLNVVLVQTTDYVLREKWEHTLSSSLPMLITCDSVFKNQKCYIAPIISNFKTDKNNRADVRYAVKIFGPDNSVYLSYENIPLLNKTIDNTNLQLSDSIVAICFNENDVFGTYKIRMEVTDKIARRKKTIESEIVLTSLPAYDQYQVKDDAEFIAWINGYYKSPSPEKALSYYLFFANSELSDKDDAFWKAFCLFLEIVNNNPFLYQQVLNCYQSQNELTRIFLLYLLTYSDIESPAFFDKLEGSEKTIYLELKDEPMVNLYDSVKTGMHLDMLWATFLASGSYRPVLKLIQTLDYEKYQNALDTYATSEQTEEDTQRATYNAIFNALLWSICANYENHKLVSDYCDWACQHENLTDVQRNILQEIIATSKHPT